MFEKVSIPILILLVTIIPDVVAAHAPPGPNVGAQHAAQLLADYLIPEVTVETKTVFSEEEIQVSTPLPFKVEYVDDPESEIGTEKVLQEGIDGRRTETYLAKYWYGEETEKRLLGAEVAEPQKQIVARGTKIIWRELPLADGEDLKYWRKLQVWATSYDGNCLGCRGLTYSGTPVKHGTLAVDPEVIPLGTRVYIPGYGIGRSEDIGGAVKGYKIDLGFEDVSQGWWRARWVDIYLL